MVFLKTLERLPGQDRTRSRAAKHAAKGAKFDVASNLSQVLSSGKSYQPSHRRLQTHRNHCRDRSCLDYSQLALKAMLVRRMWPRGGHGGSEKGSGALGSESNVAPWLRWWERLALGSGSGWIASGLPWVAATAEV